MSEAVEFRPSSQPGTSLSRVRKRMAEMCDLLRLDDRLLAMIALKTRSCHDETDREWAKAAARTCKRLWRLQLPSDLVIRDWRRGLKWHLERHQGAKSIAFYTGDWPTDDELEDLSASLMEASCNLQELEQLVFWPSRRSLQPLSPWILYMLSGASSLKHATLAAELLPCLPDFATLESLHIDARDAMAMWDISKALACCHQLVSLSVTCHEEGRITEVPELDLRHLVRLANCHLKFVPAPERFFLPRGGLLLELTISPEQVSAWSKLWQTIRDHVQCIAIEGYPEYSHHARPAGLLDVWPQGIANFRGLQFLQLHCDGMGESAGDALDLAQLSYIPHVSLRSTGHLIVKISKGSCRWKVLEIQSERVFSVIVEDAKSFLRDTGVFYFKYPVVEYPEWTENLKKPWDLSQELKRAGEEVRKPVHEYSDTSRLGDESVEPPMLVLSNCQEGRSIEDNGFRSARLKFASGSPAPDESFDGAFASCHGGVHSQAPNLFESHQSILPAFS